jgi:nucleoside-diphosphate kinase
MADAGSTGISSAHLERTLVLVKPDGVRRALIGDIIRRLDATGLKLIGSKLVQVDRPFAERHYTYEDIAVRHGEAIRNQLLEYITEGPVAAMVYEGIGAVAVVRKLCGSTEPAKSAPGTIRGDYCHQSYALCNDAKVAVRNVIHASATPEEAATEVALWFPDRELVSYRRSDQNEHFLD